MFLLDLIFPNRCVNCNRIIGGEELICALCYDQIDFTHYEFGEENLLKERCKVLFPVENAFALMQFEKENISRKIVHQLKYGKREKIGKILANWVSDRLNFENSTPDLMVTIPLHPKKMKIRGYNQLHLFANTLSEKFNIPCDHTLLKRNFHRSAQAKKNKEQRSTKENLFSLTKDISGKHILVIDDVFTTGNTMNSAVWEILKNPDNRISILIIAVDS